MADEFDDQIRVIRAHAANSPNSGAFLTDLTAEGLISQKQAFTVLKGMPNATPDDVVNVLRASNSFDLGQQETPTPTLKERVIAGRKRPFEALAIDPSFVQFRGDVEEFAANATDFAKKNAAPLFLSAAIPLLITATGGTAALAAGGAFVGGAGGRGYVQVLQQTFPKFFGTMEEETIQEIVESQAFEGVISALPEGAGAIFAKAGGRTIKAAAPIDRQGIEALGALQVLTGKTTLSKPAGRLKTFIGGAARQDIQTGAEQTIGRTREVPAFTPAELTGGERLNVVQNVSEKGFLGRPSRLSAQREFNNVIDEKFGSVNTTLGDVIKEPGEASGMVLEDMTKLRNQLVEDKRAAFDELDDAIGSDLVDVEIPLSRQEIVQQGTDPRRGPQQAPRLTRKSKQFVGGVRFNPSGLRKEFTEDRVIFRAIGERFKKASGQDVVEAVFDAGKTNVDGKVGFKELKQLRTAVRAEKEARINPHGFAKQNQGEAVRRLNNMEQRLSTLMRSEISEQAPGALPLWEKANALTVREIQTYRDAPDVNTFLNDMADGGGKASTAVDRIVKPNEVDAVKALRAAGGDRAVNTVGRHVMGKILKGAGRAADDQINGFGLEKQLEKWGKATLTELWGANVYGNMLNIAKAVKPKQATREQLGGMTIQLMQAGAVFRVTDLGPGGQAARAVFIVPYLGSKILESKALTDLIIKGASTPAITREGAALSLRLLDALSRFKNTGELPENGSPFQQAGQKLADFLNIRKQNQTTNLISP